MTAYVITGGFILFDIITGFLKALYKRKLNSTVLRRGLFHKLAEIMTVAGCGLLEYATVYYRLNIDMPLLAPVSMYIIVMELISILENLAEVNPQLLKLFQPYLEKLKQEQKKE